MKAFFHVQHLLGVGHLKRAATLARAFHAAGFEVTLASGGMPVADIPVSVQLPPVRAADLTFKALLPKPGRYRLWTQLRRGDVVSTVRFTVTATSPNTR